MWVEKRIICQLVNQGGLKGPEINNLDGNYFYFSPLNIFFLIEKKNGDNFLVFFLIVKYCMNTITTSDNMKNHKEESKHDL